MDTETIEYLIYSAIMILAGFGIRKYLKWAKINNLRMILGINVFWIKLWGYIFIIVGFVSFIFLALALYGDLTI